MRRQQWLVNQLPFGMTEDQLFVRFVSMFEEVATRLLEDADNVGDIADATVAPEDLVRYLATWIGVESIDPSLPGELQRRILRSAARTLVWRGTRAGLQQFLEIMSGGPARVEDGGGVWRADEAPTGTSWVRLHVTSTGWMSERDFVALVADEVPAYVTVELWVGDRQVWPQPAALPDPLATEASA